MIPVENRSLFLRLEAEGNKSLDLGDYALSLAEWDFYKNNGSDLVRINVSPSDHPVYDTKGDQEIFWHRTSVGTIAVTDRRELERIIAGRR
ncbi:MAG: hypothetical protein OXH10_03725 [bacterium]|nr:hypothetical protein [bacterium]